MVLGHSEFGPCRRVLGTVVKILGPQRGESKQAQEKTFLNSARQKSPQSRKLDALKKSPSKQSPCRKSPSKQSPASLHSMKKSPTSVVTKERNGGSDEKRPMVAYTVVKRTSSSSTKQPCPLNNRGTPSKVVVEDDSSGKRTTMTPDPHRRYSLSSQKLFQFGTPLGSHAPVLRSGSYGKVLLPASPWLTGSPNVVRRLHMSGDPPTPRRTEETGVVDRTAITAPSTTVVTKASSPSPYNTNTTKPPKQPSTRVSIGGSTTIGSFVPPLRPSADSTAQISVHTGVPTPLRRKCPLPVPNSPGLLATNINTTTVLTTTTQQKPTTPGAHSAGSPLDDGRRPPLLMQSASPVVTTKAGRSYLNAPPSPIVTKTPLLHVGSPLLQRNVFRQVSIPGLSTPVL